MKLVDRIPRIAYQVGIRNTWSIKNKSYTEWGYVIFGIKNLKENLKLERENSENDDDFTWRPVFISPAKLETRGEFSGW